MLDEDIVEEALSEGGTGVVSEVEAALITTAEGPDIMQGTLAAPLLLHN